MDAPLVSERHVTLSGSAAAHLTRVLRMAAGEALTVFNGQGGEYAALIEAAHGKQVTLAVGEHRAIERESPLALTLVQGISRGERMDMVVQKATELGVAQIVPVLSERSVVRLAGTQAQGRCGHWRAIAASACEQCGRNRIPQLAEPVALDAWLRATGSAAPAPHSLRLILQPQAAQGLDALAGPLTALTVLIGPEGGLTGAEASAALASGFMAVRLGPRVLRTETAAVAALALLQRQFGDLA